MAHQLDPNHPTMTVVAEIGGSKVKHINELCPDIDVVGINSYGGGPSVGDRYKAVGGVKPYAITEFGPAGTWESGKNAWGVVPELTSTAKASAYRATYEKTVLANPLSLGSYAFTWGNKQEATATWFGLLLPDGSRLGAVDTLSELWSGKKPANLCPAINALKVNGPDSVTPGAPVKVTLDATDPEHDPLAVKWVLQLDPAIDNTGGATQATPPTFPEAITKSDTKSATLQMPKIGGPYRLYAFVHDDHGGAAVANLPLNVTGGEAAPPSAARKAALPLTVYGETGGDAPYTPAGYMGNAAAIKMDEGSTVMPHSGKTCLQVNYTANDNWGGVVLWENNERFCHREDSTAANSCPIAGVATPALCVAGTINNPPYLADCRWETQNVQVHDNELHIDKNALNCLNTQCGQMGLFSNFGNNPGWSPYLGTVTQEAITFTDNNHFSANHYFGDWHYDAYTPGRVLDLSEWQAAPYLQDRDSTLIAGVSNYLDADTSTVEGSTGQWVKWFSDNITRSTAEAHGGTHSLKVDITAPYGWGVTLKNHPGFSTNPGAKELSFWAKAGVGSNLGVTMTVDWRGASGASLKTDVLELPSLTSTWQQAKVVVSVPAGTARLNVNLTGSSGNAGDSLFIDDVVVADTAVSPPPPPVNTAGNYLDAETSTIEGTVGQWVKWFSDNVSRSTAEAHNGTSSLRIDVTAPYGWGVTLKNYPGFVATPGNKALSFWAKAGSGAGLGATMSVQWRTASGATIRTDTVELPSLTTAWQQATAIVNAPAGTARVSVDFSNSSGVAGNSLFIDDVVIVDSTVAPPPPPVNFPGNLIDTDTATIEGSALGQWVKWFSDNVSQSATEAHSGTHSMAVDITAQYGWGVTLKNNPGFAAAPGAKTLSFWAKAGSGSNLGATMVVQWRTSTGSVIRTDTLENSGLTSAWKQATASVTAPAGTAWVSVDFSNPSGGPGDRLVLDDIIVSAP